MSDVPVSGSGSLDHASCTTSLVRSARINVLKQAMKCEFNLLDHARYEP